MGNDVLFEKIQNFFFSLSKSLNNSSILLITVGLFIVSVVVVFILCAHSYENKLLRTINKMNKYFQTSPKIDESNLVEFNARMRADGVPKQLRKQWQAYVLYQEHKASEYMSYDNCVKEPMKNSTYNRDVKALSYVAVITASLSLVLNCFRSYDTTLAKLLSTILVAPTLIILLDCLATIFLNARHTSILADLTNNYQYFEANMDKATETIPSYVDYEILFDKNEIKSGVPILYAYLQNRAAMEQKELELARLKNVEHEKFNFDDMGDDAALVLERAMQESENYIAERKKFAQDVEQINSDMAQEDIQYREQTKEYNRAMQVSRETFANFKQQLEDSTSTIQTNYIKKQQQQELDRQRNLERDFDAATEKHKNEVDGFKADLDQVEKDRDESRKALEAAMKAEFSTYKSKVYQAVRESLIGEENENLAKAEARIVALEEELAKKNEILKKYMADEDTAAAIMSESDSSQLNTKELYNKKIAPRFDEPTPPKPADNNAASQGYVFNYLPTEEDRAKERQEDIERIKQAEEKSAATRFNPTVEKEEGTNSTAYSTEESESIQGANTYIERPEPVAAPVVTQPKQEPATTYVAPKPAGKRGRPRKEVTEQAAPKPAGKRGRPRKEATEQVAPKPAGKRGRPRKEATEQVAPKPAAQRGRPRKDGSAPVTTVAIPNKPKDRPRGGQNGGGMLNSGVDDLDAFLQEIDAAIKLENDKIKAAGKAIESKGNFDENPKR